jgi:hypothetical protein
MKKILFTIALSIIVKHSIAQLVNTNQIFIAEGAVVSIGLDLINSGELINNGKVYLKGNFNNNAVLSSKGEVLIDGESSQFFSGTSEIRISKITIQNNLALNNKLIVMDELSFANGILNTNENILEFDQGASHSGANTYSHVVGTVKKKGLGFFEFPLGDGSDYKGFSTNTKTNSYLEASYIPESPVFLSPILDANIAELNQTEYWTLKSEINDDIQISFNRKDENIAYLNGGIWKKTKPSDLIQSTKFTSSTARASIKEIGVWPNPTQGDFNLKLTGMRDVDQISVDLINQDGRAIMKMQGTVNELRKAYSLPKEMTTTTLTIRVINGLEVMTQNLILNR